MSFRTLTTLALPLVVLLAGCGGKTAGITGQGGSPSADAGTPGTDGGSPLPDGGTIISGDAGGRCVHIEPDELTTSCASDSECTVVATGDICDGECDCGGTTPVNTAGAALYDSLITGVITEPCHCAAAGFPACVSGQCTYCPAGPGTCTGPIDGGVIISTDASIGPSDAGPACVDIDVADYDTSCNVDSDCVNIQTGEVCQGDCECGGTPVNVDGDAQYDQATSGIQFGECGCPAEPSPVCNSGQCVQAELTGG